MSMDWDSLLSKFEALQLWAVKSLKSQNDWKDNPEKTPFFVAHAGFLYANAEGMLELIPVLQDDDRFQDLEMGIENFILFFGFPENTQHVVQVWSEKSDEYTLSIFGVAEHSTKHIDTVPIDDVPDVLAEYIAHLETIVRHE